MSKKAVTVIPATINRFTSAAINDVRKRRTAGYARVSTDHEEQLTAYIRNSDKGIKVGSKLRNVNIVPKQSSYGQYNLVNGYQIAA